MFNCPSHNLKDLVGAVALCRQSIVAGVQHPNAVFAFPHLGRHGFDVEFFLGRKGFGSLNQFANHHADVALYPNV